VTIQWNETSVKVRAADGEDISVPRRSAGL